VSLRGKRHLLVDTLGWMLLVVVTAASMPERDRAKLLFAKLHRRRQQFSRLVRIWVDGGYSGEGFIRLYEVGDGQVSMD